MGSKGKLILGLRIVALLALIGVATYLTAVYYPQVVEYFGRRQELKDYIEAQGLVGVAIFIFFQVFQVVVATIPGEIVQIAGGYIYGVFWGTIYLVIGVVIGSVINFFIARWLGFKIIKAFIPEKRLTQLHDLVRGAKSDFGMFMLFLIPGLPKDILTYVAGLTPVPAGRFLIIAIVARLPALIGSSFIGASLQREITIIAIVVSGVAVILFMLGVIFRDKIISLVRK